MSKYKKVGERIVEDFVTSLFKAIGPRHLFLAVSLANMSANSSSFKYFFSIKWDT